MPQMAPINWLTLFIMFCITLIMFSMMSYYSITLQSPETQGTSKLSPKSFNWKW